MKRLALFAIAAVLAVASSMPVQAERGVRIGLLTCHVNGGIGWIIGSTKSADCTFKSSHENGRDRYAGSLTRFGLDLGVTNGATLVWAVVAPTRMHRGSLSGGYLGAGAEATIGVGLGANVLIGGFRNSINLLPLSVQGQTGLNIAGGIGSLTLKSH
ncbi:MAG: DUF992 domain-containing protein [Pseudomonadota bacterium]|nr:DUF992 domain-containing protein [Pseudomonadota bacterium]